MFRFSTGPRKEGLGPAYVAGFREALASGARPSPRWMPTSHMTRPTCPACWPPPPTPISCSARATCAGGGVREWGPLRRADQPRRMRLCPAVLGVAVHDLTGGFKVFRREVLEAIDLGSISAFGYAFQVETTYRAIRAGFGSTRSRSSSATAGSANRR